MLELVLKGATAPGCSVPLGDRPIRIGRATTCDLVLTDPSVSGQHALLFLEGGRVWIQDVGSSNGTFVNGRRIRGNTVLQPGDVIGLGPTTELTLAGRASDVLPTDMGLAVEDVATKMLVGVTGDRFVIGDGPEVSLRVPGVTTPTTLLVYPDGEVWIGRGTEDTHLPLREVFVVGGRELRLVPVSGTSAPTSGVLGDNAYEIRAWLGNSDERPLAVVSDPTSGVTCRFEAGNRAIFLYLLARRHAEDARNAVPETDRGWTGDPELLMGLWGKRGDMNRLYVLLHRVRADLKEAGFDPWFLERRRHGLRARVAKAQIDPPRREA